MKLFFHTDREDTIVVRIDEYGIHIGLATPGKIENNIYVPGDPDEWVLQIDSGGTLIIPGNQAREIFLIEH